jgi:hypothetical protein
VIADLLQKLLAEGGAPDLGDPVGVDAVEGELPGADGAAGRGDAEEVPTVRSGVVQVHGDPRRIGDEVAQLPVVVGEPADDVSQVLGVHVQSAVGPVDHDVVRDELREVLEPVLVAAGVVAAVEPREPIVGHAREDARPGPGRHARNAAPSAVLRQAARARPGR